MSFLWRTRGDGIIEVDHGDGAGFGVPDLPFFETSTARAIARTGQWNSLVEQVAGARGMSIPWCLGVIYAESGGDPRAESRIRDKDGNLVPGARGLMQIMPFIGKAYGVSNPDDLFTPGINVDVGSRILTEYAAQGHDVPQCASMYNAGPSTTTGGPKSSTTSPWGMVEDKHYISTVVAATNHFTRVLGFSTSPRQSAAKSSGFGLLALGGLAFLALRK